jgi:hypothetical protein
MTVNISSHPKNALWLMLLLELDMLDFTGPLQDLFTTPHTLDGHFQALGATDTTLESLLSATPNDPQIIHLSNHSTALSDEPLQIERNEDRVSKRLREDRCLTVPSPPETDSGDNQNSDKYNSTSQRDPIQRLLGLQSTLQKIPKPCTDERAQKSDGTWTPQTAIEEAFIATDKLVSVIEEINDQASYDTSWNANFPYRNNSNTDAERSRLRPPGEESTSLLVLSCYVCLLEIYQVQIVSMCDEAEDTVYGPGKNTGRRRSNPPARASTFSSSPTNIPVLNIGQFNLGMSPVRNIGLLLYVTQDMVGRLQSVVQHCVSSNNEIETYSFMHTRNDSHPRAGQPVFRTRRMDIETGRIQDGGTVRAMSFMFDSILKGIEARETQLKASIQEVKNILNNSS